jgi:hypothetical protein
MTQACSKIMSSCFKTAQTQGKRRQAFGNRRLALNQPMLYFYQSNEAFGTTRLPAKTFDLPIKHRICL